MEEPDAERIAERLWAALHTEPSFDPLRDRVRAALDHTTATPTGQVGNIAVKRRILGRIVRRTGPHSELTSVVDRLRVIPARRMPDGEIRALLRDALSMEPMLADCTLRCRSEGAADTLRHVRDRQGAILVEVRDGVVTLSGEVPDLAHRQMAGVLGWWVPGCRDVINELAEKATTVDRDGQLAETVRTALDRDGSIDAGGIRVEARDAVVWLRGAVSSAGERERAEFDAWYVFGVNKVEDGLELTGLQCRTGTAARSRSQLHGRGGVWRLMAAKVLSVLCELVSKIHASLTITPTPRATQPMRLSGSV